MFMIRKIKFVTLVSLVGLSVLLPAKILGINPHSVAISVSAPQDANGPAPVVLSIVR